MSNKIRNIKRRISKNKQKQKPDKVDFSKAKIIVDPLGVLFGEDGNTKCGET